MKKNTTVYILAGALTILACLSILLLVSNSRKKVIIEDITAGIGKGGAKIIVDSDRKSAIRKALESAGEGDVVILAGKGQETYQILADGKIHFDEREVVAEILAEGN